MLSIDKKYLLVLIANTFQLTDNKCNGNISNCVSTYAITLFIMVSPVILGIIIGLAIYRFYKFCVHRPEGFPPGPFRIPVFGSYLFLLLINFKYLHLAVEKLCKFFESSVIGFYTGDYLTVLATDQKSIREVFFNPDFDGYEIRITKSKEFSSLTVTTGTTREGSH